MKTTLLEVVLGGIFILLLKNLFERLLLVDTMYIGKIIQNVRYVNVGSILVITHTVYKQNIHVKILE